MSGSLPDPVIIAEWPITKGERLRVTLEKYNGYDLINIRKWFTTDNDTVRPGRQGIALQVKHLPLLLDAVKQAKGLATERGLLPAQERS